MKFSEKPLTEAWEAYTEKVDAYANHCFDTIVLPFCKKRGYEFCAGNGSWWIGAPDSQRPSMDEGDAANDSEFAEILECLQALPCGLPGNDLGSLMPDYDPET